MRTADIRQGEEDEKKMKAPLILATALQEGLPAPLDQEHSGQA
jgi:hypothetical protein